MYLHSVTSLMVDKDGVMMLTGDSMGFIQVKNVAKSIFSPMTPP